MPSTFFPNARKFAIHGGEFSHVNGNQTKSSFNITDSYNIGSSCGIEGSFNIDWPHNRNTESRVAETTSRHKDNQVSAQDYWDERKTTNAAGSHFPPIYTRSFRTRRTQERRGPYFPQEERHHHHAPQTTRTQYLPPAFSNSDLVPFEDAPRRRQYRDSYSPERRAHHAHTATSKLKPGSRYEPRAATNANEARSTLPYAWIQNTPVQVATPHARFGSAAQQRPQPREEELVASRRHRYCDRNEVIQRPPVQDTKHWAQEWEQDLFDCGCTRSVTPCRAPSKNSRSESIDNTPLPLPSPFYVSSSAKAGYVRQDLASVSVTPRRQVELIDFHLRRVPGGKQSTAKFRHRYEEAKRKNVWGHRPLKSRVSRRKNGLQGGY